MMHLVPFFRVPELARNPFHNLKKLTFEAAKLPHHVAKFILGHSCSLTELVLILDELCVENFKGRHTKLQIHSNYWITIFWTNCWIFSGILQLLIDNPRPYLTRVGFYFSKAENLLKETEQEPLKLSPTLLDFIQVNEALNYLHVYVRSGNHELKNDLQIVSEQCLCHNWKLEFKSEIVLPRNVTRNVWGKYIVCYFILLYEITLHKLHGKVHNCCHQNEKIYSIILTN